MAKKGDAAKVATACIKLGVCCVDGLHTKPDENVVATTCDDKIFCGICTPGFAVCEPCEGNPTKTALSVLEASQPKIYK